MNFALDLIDAVAMERPDEVLPLVRQAAQTGQHLVVRRWLDDHGFVDGASTPEFIDAMVQMTRSAERMGQGGPAGETFVSWARQAFSGRSMDLSKLLDRCVPQLTSWNDRCELAAKSLLQLGADPLAMAQQGGCESARALAGTKVGLTERNVTLAAQAMQIPGEFGASFLERISTPRNPWPTIAEVGVDGQFFPVNAAGYALALGDLRALQTAISTVQGDERDISEGLNHAITFALSSGLVDRCTPEVHHGLAMCIARGADLDAGMIGQELAGLKAALSPEVFGATDARYSIATLFLGCPEERAVVGSITRLARDYGLGLNGPASDADNAASLLHYAVVTDRASVVKALVSLGADEDAVDPRGMKPADWANVMGRKQAYAALIGQDVDPSLESEWPADAVPGQRPLRAVPGTAAAAQRASAPVDGGSDSVDQVWSPDDAPSLTLEEIEAQSAPPDYDYVPDDLPQVDHDFDPGFSASPESAAVAAAPINRDRVAPSVSVAKASRAATLFDNLLASQAKTRERAAALVPQKDLAAAGADMPSPSSANRGFKRRPGP